MNLILILILTNWRYILAATQLFFTKNEMFFCRHQLKNEQIQKGMFSIHSNSSTKKLGVFRKKKFCIKLNKFIVVDLTPARGYLGASGH